MNDTDIYPEDPQDAVDLTGELDDVEGHGLKEVAAGLGAAAVLAGGAAGATQLVGTHAAVHPSKGGDVSITVSDPIATAARTTHNAFGTAQATTDGALGTADRAIDSSLKTVGNAPTTAGNLADATLQTAGSTVAKATSTVQDTKAWATGPVLDTAKGDVKGATSTATGVTDRTMTTADTTAGSAVTTAGAVVRDADRKVATILSVATTTAVDGVHTAVVTVRAVNAGAGADTNTAGGWVLVKAGDNVLAQVHLAQGQATASWTMPLVGGHAVTISYTGDDTFAASMRSITL